MLHVGLNVALSAVIALVVIPGTIGLCRRYELFDFPARHKRHKSPVPNLGGGALFVSVWLSFGVLALVQPGVIDQFAGSLLYLFAGSLIILLVGVSDDLKPVSAWVKLSAQVAAGFVLYLGDLRIDPLSIPFMGSHALGNWSLLVTIVWVVAMTNAVNLIDGLDGLASGVCLIASATMLTVGWLYNVGGVVLMSALLLGFLLVFLMYNRYPAKIFLGDSGSLQLGYYFAVMSLLVPIKSYTAAALYLPLMALGVPLLETVSSIVRRLASGRRVMQADRRHLFHYLALAGMSRRSVVWVFWSLSLVFGGFTLAMYFWHRRIVFALLILFMVVIFVGFYIFISGLQRRKIGRGRPDRPNQEPKTSG